MAVKKRKRYDDKFRASAVVMLEAAGYPDKKGALALTANHLHVPAPTLHRWYQGKNNPPPSELVTEKRADLKTMIADELRAALQEMLVARPGSDYRELGTVFGILFDKLQLLEGKPTDRTEVIDNLTDTDRAARIAALLNTARARRTGQPDNDGEYVQ